MYVYVYNFDFYLFTYLILRTVNVKICMLFYSLISNLSIYIFVKSFSFTVLSSYIVYV